MSYNHQQTATYGTQAVDLGLQSFMRSVYNRMGLGLVVTGLTAFGVAHTPALYEAIFGNKILSYVAIFAPLAFILFGFTPGRMAKMTSGGIAGLFTLFSVLMGVSMATIFTIFTDESIARVFFIAASMFAATSLYGYTTKKDLTRMGSFMFMGMIGILIAGVVNLFIGSEAVHFAVSVIGVIVFTGLAAWDTQRLKETYSYAHGSEEANAKLAVMGALSLYLNFVNLFQLLLNLAGNRE